MGAGGIQGCWWCLHTIRHLLLCNICWWLLVLLLHSRNSLWSSEFYVQWDIWNTYLNRALNWKVSTHLPHIRLCTDRGSGCLSWTGTLQISSFAVNSHMAHCQNIFCVWKYLLNSHFFFFFFNVNSVMLQSPLTQPIHCLSSFYLILISILPTESSH